MSLFDQIKCQWTWSRRNEYTAIMTWPNWKHSVNTFWKPSLITLLKRGGGQPLPLGEPFFREKRALDQDVWLTVRRWMTPRPSVPFEELKRLKCRPVLFQYPFGEQLICPALSGTLNDLIILRAMWAEYADNWTNSSCLMVTMMSMVMSITQ